MANDCPVVCTRFWSLTYDYFKKDVKKPEDGLIVLVHWLLLKNDFRVLGSGSENEIGADEQPTDILPENWSQNVTSYYMRYTRDKTLFLLNGVKAGDNNLIFNFYNVTTKHVSSAAIGDIATTVKSINSLPKNNDDFIKTVCLLQKDLIDPMQKESDDKKTTSTQTQSSSNVHNNTYQSSGNDPLRSASNVRINILRNPSLGYGISDLDPLGHLYNPGRGMIFDPLGRRGRIGDFPGVPPMARFDPIRPRNPDPFMPGGNGARMEPDPDHMRPLNFDDNNMFM